jgi:membrane protein DedA with SNARE-associated domain
MTDLIGSDLVLVVLFAFAVLDGFFPPVPSETAVIALTAAWGAGDGGPAPLLVVAVAACGAFTGDQLAYLVGRRASGRIGRARGKGARAFVRAGEMVQRHGGTLLLAARFVPGGRVAVTTAAGALGFPRTAYVAWTAAGGVAWGAYYASIGALSGSWLQGNTLLAIVIGVAGGVLLGAVANRCVTAMRRAGATPDDVQEEPPVG